jgi:predicted unusual protein kinase regulating ubiquinone biosynthesis (AarF/ABC1/UbiB family)
VILILLFLCVPAANAQRFTELYAGVTDVFVPKIYSDLTTRKVLVMEWVDGFRLTDNASLEQYGLDRSKLVDTLVQCSLRQILENGTSKQRERKFHQHISSVATP